MITFASLLANPALLTPELRSPIVHPDGTVTILWEGDGGEGGLACIPEWTEGPVSLAQIPGTNLWGADLEAPPIPATICTRIPIGRAGQPMLSPRHNPVLLGPDVPAPVGAAQASARLDLDTALPLGEEQRRVRVFLPAGALGTDPLPILVALDAQLFVDRNPALPRITDRLAEEGRIPPVILVALDNSTTNRGGEYQAGTPENEAARAWVWDQVLPLVRQRYLNAGPAWILGFSMGGGFAAQLLLGRPDLLKGGALISPAHGEGKEAVFEAVFDAVRVAEGDQRVWLSHGDFGRWEEATLAATAEMAALLARRGATVQFQQFPGFGHTLEAMERAFGPALCWLLGQ